MVTPCSVSTLVSPLQVINTPLDVANVPAAPRGLLSLPSDGSVVTDTITLWKRWIADHNAQFANLEQVNKAHVRELELAHKRLRGYKAQAIKDESNRRLALSQAGQFRTPQVQVSSLEACM